MAQITIPYLVAKPGAKGRPLRYFWQPGKELRRCGWPLLRVPAQWRELHDPAALELAAIAAANAQNAEVAAWRAGRSAGGGGGGSGAAAARPAPQLVQPKTLAALIKFYRDSGYPSVKNWPQPLAPKTRIEYEAALKRLEAWGGDTQVAAIKPAALRTLYEDLAAPGDPRLTPRPVLAARLIATAQALFKFGRLKGGWGLDDKPNPADKLGLAGARFSGLLWPKEAVAAFVAMADQMERWSIGTAIVVNEWLGQREADVLGFRRDVLDAKGLLLRQRKTGAGVKLPLSVVPALVARIEQELARQVEHGVSHVRLILSERTGEPFTGDDFRHEFAAVRAALAAEQRRQGGAARFAVDYLPPGADSDDPFAFTVPTGDLRFMHLRHTAVTRLLEAGNTAAEAAVITGHSLATVDTIMKHYHVRTGAQAAAALQRRVDKEGM